MSTNTPIASQTLTSAAASITFSGIPQGYTDLVLVINSYSSLGSADNAGLVFNGDSGTNYSWTRIYGTGSSAIAGRSSSSNQIGQGTIGGSNTDRSGLIYNIMNYSNTTTYKTVICRGSTASEQALALVGLWRSTSAITSLTLNLYASGANYGSGSTFNLYGIASGSPKANGGNTVTTDGTYWYHTFTSSGVFTPADALTADYLVVAGGGGGGGNRGGGGGAGGYRYFTAQSLTTNTIYTVTVGAGGSGGNVNLSTAATSGSTSTFNTSSASGGGRGGQNSVAPATGGSGGGAGGTTTGNPSLAGAAGNSGSYSPVEGYSGGSAIDGTAGGGGGGSSGAGTAAINTTHPQSNKGAGTTNSISGSSVTYAEGGNGGGTNVSDVTGVAGTANRGNGGGGAANQNNNSYPGGAGGSGIVIVRYPV